MPRVQQPAGQDARFGDADHDKPAASGLRRGDPRAAPGGRRHRADETGQRQFERVRTRQRRAILSELRDDCHSIMATG